MGHPLLRFEIAGRDGEALEKFYGEVLGWSIKRKTVGGHPYGMVKTDGEGTLEGGIRHEPEGMPEVVLYFGVPDLAGTVAAAELAGATVRIAPMVTPDVTFALIEDPEGNPIGLVQKK